MPGISMAELPSGGIVSYGNFVFPSNTETTAISIVPQYDAAGRTVIYNRIKISLRCILAGTLIDADVREIAQILSKPAYPFRYLGRGYGLLVNVGSIRDVVWGPKPSDVNVKVLGGGNAVELTASIECAIPDGPNARFQFAPLEFSLAVVYDVDRSGLTTRTVQGYLRIPMTRKSPTDRTLPDNIDTYREDIVPPLVEGFRRATPGSFTLNPAKDQINFRFADEEFESENVPPVGCIDATGRHRVSCPPMKFREWHGTIECEYEIARNGVATIADARNAFFALVRDRLGATVDTISRVEPTLVAGGSTKGSVIPVSFSMSEDIYGKPKAGFTLNYKVTGPSLRAILQSSGMWRPVPGSDWKLWSASVEDILGPRGRAGLVFSIDDDQIVDLLQPGLPDATLSNRAPNRGKGLSAVPNDIFPDPDPDGSWLEWNMTVYQETDNGVVEIRTLPTDERTVQGDVYGSSAGGGLVSSAILGAVSAAYPIFTAKDPFFFPPPRTAQQQKAGGMATPQRPQRRARQGGAVYLRGSALRVKYAIPAPSLRRWGKAELVPANRPDMGEGFWTAVVGNSLWPIIGAAWNLRYIPTVVVADTPPVIPDPLQGGGGTASAAQAAGAAIGDVLAGSKLWRP